MQVNREILWLMVIPLLFGPFVAPVYARQVPDLSEQIDAYLTRVEKERGLDAAVLVALSDEVILRRGYGLADEATRAPFSAETAVGVASISKQFTAAAIMRLVDQGKLSVTDTLGEYFPDVPADKAGITLHQLLTHTSGLKSDHMESDLDPLTKQNALERIFSAPLQSKPGAAFSYSNSGYTLLAAVVEEVSGQEHDTFLQNQFFIPLGMKSTGNWADPRFDSLPAATGYMNGESSGPLNQLAGPFWTVVGNGGIVSTVDDMLTWFQALYSGKVLSPESTRAIFTSYTTDKGQILEYGYGWEVSELEQLGRLITHNGGGLTGNSILSYYPDLKLTIIILGNRIIYQVLGPLPLVIELPADETSREIARGVNSGNFSTTPRMTFFIYPYLGVLIGLLVSIIVMIVWFKRRQTIKIL